MGVTVAAERADAEILADEVRRAFGRNGIRLGADECERFGTYLSLLEHWNARVNLTAIRDRPTAILRHFIEPALARPLLAGAGPTLLDVGSGPGVPGLPLKILEPDRDLILVESSGKKATFLREATDALGLTGVRIIGRRLEDAVADGELAPPVHVLTARAWTDWGPMLGRCAALMAPGGRAILFVGPATLRALRRVLGGGTAGPRENEVAWAGAARAGWVLRRVEGLPHLDTGVIATLEIPTR